MMQTILFKALKVIRGTALLVGGAVMLALLLGVASTAVAHKGDRGFFHLGHNNVSKVVTTLIKKGTGPALSLKVGAGQPPLAVNSSGKVANLNSDRLDGIDSSVFMKKGQKAADSEKLDGVDSTGFYTAGSKVTDSAHADQADNAGNLDGQPSSAYQKRVNGACPQNSSIRAVNESGTVTCESNAATAGTAGFANNAGNADKLDNKDSTAFGVKTDHARQLAQECDTVNVFNECAPVTVTVPAGKQYHVSVWSSFSAANDPGFAGSQAVRYCSAGRGPSIGETISCITPFGIENEVQVHSYSVAASSSGETVPLDPGTYTFSTAIKPMGAAFAGSNGWVITKVLIRDRANAL